MGEHSNVNLDAAIRREARRKKILENSTNRLRRIEGLISSYEKSQPEETANLTFEGTHLTSPKEPEARLPDLNIPSEIPRKLNQLSQFLLENEKSNDGNENKYGPEFMLDEEEEEEETSQKSYLRFIVEKKIHYILLALVVHVLLYCNAGYLFFENIFCPFYTVKIIELFSKREEKENCHPVVFIMMATFPRNFQKIFKIIVTTITALFSELFLYLFTFIIGTKIINIEV